MTGSSPIFGLVKQGGELEVGVVKHFPSFCDVVDLRLQFVHLQGLLHRWINPSHVIFVRNDVPSVPSCDVLRTAIVEGF